MSDEINFLTLHHRGLKYLIFLSLILELFSRFYFINQYFQNSVHEKKCRTYLIKIYRVYVTYSVILTFALTVEERKRPLKRFTPPRKLGDGSETESGSEYSDDDYSESSYT